jgi:porin
MKKNILASAFLLALCSMQTVQAETMNIAPNETKSTVFNQIVLQNDEIASTERVAIAEDASPMQRSLENKQNEVPLNVEEKTIPVFDLKGGVTKENPNVELSKAPSAVSSWLNGDYATGKWFGARPLFEDHGVTVNSSLLYSPMFKNSGGANDKTSGKGYTLFNLGVTLDTEKAGLWKGGKFYALYQKKTGYGISGPNGDSGVMGDWMGLDGWDWRQMSQMSEYWYQQELFDKKLRMKVGKQDANCDFGYLNSGWNFMNTAFSVNPTTPMPTYPDQAFGFMAEINPKEWLSIRNGTYSRYSNPFNISEIEVKSNIKKKPGRYMVGAWEMSDTTGMSVATGVDPSAGTIYNNFNRNFGGYVGFEQMVYKEKLDDDNDLQGLIVFGQAGMSPSNKNDMSKYLGGGINYVGPIKNRDKDILGIGVASGNFASRLGDITGQVGSETVVECFYRAQITPWAYLQPDVQFIMNPSGMYGNSVAFGVRSVIVF